MQPIFSAAHAQMSFGIFGTNYRSSHGYFRLTLPLQSANNNAILPFVIFTANAIVRRHRQRLTDKPWPTAKGGPRIGPMPAAIIPGEGR